jgi:hypothetical protein
MRVAIYLILFAFAVYLALAKGSGPERRMAYWLFASLPVQYGLRHLIPAYYGGLDYVGFVIDLSTLIYAWRLSFTANRIWPLWVAASQLIAVSGHLFRTTSFQLNTVVYVIITRFPAWVVCFALILGTIIHLHYYKKYGSYPAWLKDCPLEPR